MDTQGHLLAVKVTAASTSDLQGAKAVLEPLKDQLPRMQLLWGDSHYGGTLVPWVKEHLGWKVCTVKGLVGTQDGENVKETTEAKEPHPPRKGFQVQPRRWVVERTFAWIIRFRRLCRDHEGLPLTSEAFIMLASSRRMLTKLAPASPTW